MHIVFCADIKALPGLHVAAFSLLERISHSVDQTLITIFSDELTESHIALLRRTLDPVAKPFRLALRRVDSGRFSGLRELNGSRTTYYRLLAAGEMDVSRFLYVDCDTLCDLDVSGLIGLDMGSAPAAWVPEAPLSRAADRKVAQQLGNREEDLYFNAGVMLINVGEWRRQAVSEQALAYLRSQHPQYWDQSALNFVLHRKAMILDSRFNCIANMRKNWPALKEPYGKINRLVHFLDYPKPWDFLGEWVHPQNGLWRSVLKQTQMSSFRSWLNPRARALPRNRRTLNGYKKALKDRFLFAGYSRGVFKGVKGLEL